jgi:hypothetical protein
MRRRLGVATGLFLLPFVLAHANGPLAYTALPSGVEPIRFTDVTGPSGIDFKHENSPTTQKYLIETMGGGIALFDYDNDGWLDVFFTNGARLDDPMPKGKEAEKSLPRFANRLFRNNGDGSFGDVTERAGLAGLHGYGMGAAVGDYDNDGFLDLYVTSYGANVLYHNDGNGHFTDVSATAGMTVEKSACMLSVVL